MDEKQQQLLAKRNGLPSVDHVRILLAAPEQMHSRKKTDKQILDNLNLGEIVDMPFSQKKEVLFEPVFDDLIKLEPKKNLPKLSKAERRKRQQEREQELQNVLVLKQAGQIEAEEILKIANEGGEI